MIVFIFIIILCGSFFLFFFIIILISLDKEVYLSKVLLIPLIMVYIYISPDFFIYLIGGIVVVFVRKNSDIEFFTLVRYKFSIYL